MAVGGGGEERGDKPLIAWVQPLGQPQVTSSP